MPKPLTGPRPFRPERFRTSMELAEQCQGGIEAVPTTSRFRAAGRTAKRALRRVLRFYLAPQIGFNTGVLETLRETERSLGELARRTESSSSAAAEVQQAVDGLAARIQEIEGFFPELTRGLEDASAAREKLSRRTGELEGAVPELSGGLELALRELHEEIRNRQLAGGAIVERIEAVEGFLPDLSSDLKTSLADQQAALEIAHDRLESIEGSLPDLSRDLETKIAREDAAIRASLQRLENDLPSLSRDLEVKIADQMTTVRETQERITRLEGSLPDLSREMQTALAEQRGMLRDTLERVEGVESYLPQLTRDIESDLATLRTESAAFGRQIDEVGGELVATGRDIDQLREDSASFEDELDRIREQHAELSMRIEAPADIGHFDFARRYRGDPIQLAKHLRRYAQIFGPVGRVLDFGCGRGEFLEVCREIGVGAYGVDSDPDMVSHCRLTQNEVLEQNALDHLRGLEDRSLDGIFSAQVVEHLTPWEIYELVRLARDKLKRGGKFIVETINPDTLSAMRWFYLDPTHRQPVPAEMLRYLLEQADFVVQDIILSSPVPDDEKLSPVKNDSKFRDPALRELVQTLNRNERRLNEILYGSQDYAIVAER